MLREFIFPRVELGLCPRIGEKNWSTMDLKLGMQMTLGSGSYNV